MTFLFESRPSGLWLFCLAGFALLALNAARSLPQLQILLSGDLPSWLTDVSEGRRAVRLLGVNQAELPTDG